jgi:CspA family cold shock protein
MSYLCALSNLIITMNKGTVKFFNESKGFGFIIEDETRKEYFVHASGLVDQISEGNQVEFELEEGRKGLNAVKVRVI